MIIAKIVCNPRSITFRMIHPTIELPNDNRFTKNNNTAGTIPSVKIMFASKIGNAMIPCKMISSDQ